MPIVTGRGTIVRPAATDIIQLHITKQNERRSGSDLQAARRYGVDHVERGGIV